MRATEQQALIHKVLAVFAEELSGLFGQGGEKESESDLFATMEKAVATVAPQSKKSVRLVSQPPSRRANVARSRATWSALIANLLETRSNTLRDGVISIRVDEDGDSSCLDVKTRNTSGAGRM